jgi:hypothetical protein
MTTPKRRVAFEPYATPTITARIGRDLTRRRELEELHRADVARWEQRQRARLERVRAIRDAEGPAGLFEFGRIVGVSTGHLHGIGLRGFGERP